MLDQADSHNLKENISDFSSHLLKSLQEPLRGAYQIADKAAGNSLPDWKAGTAASGSIAAELGEFLGSTAVFVGAAILTHKGAKSWGCAAASRAELSMLRSTGISALEMGSSGMILGALQPVDSENFWADKGKNTAHMGLSLAFMGAGSRVLASSNFFGPAQERTLRQSMALNAVAGGSAGYFDAYAKAGITQARLPSSDEVFKSTTRFAVMGTAFGAANFALAGMNRSFRLAESSKVSGIESIPKRMMQNDAAPGPAVEAVQQSNQYVTTGLIGPEKFVPGARFATANNSRGVSPEGLPIREGDKFIVFDPANDPVLSNTMEVARQKFTGKEGLTLATELKEHVAKIMNPSGRGAPEIEIFYEQKLNNGGPVFALGDFISGGNGACLPRSMVYKAIANDLGLPVRMREGFVGKSKAVPHVWNDLKLPDMTKAQLFDLTPPDVPGMIYVTTKGPREKY